MLSRSSSSLCIGDATTLCRASNEKPPMTTASNGLWVASILTLTFRMTHYDGSAQRAAISSRWPAATYEPAAQRALLQLPSGLLGGARLECYSGIIARVATRTPT